MRPFSLKKQGKETFPALTGIRAMGAASVFFVHLPFDFGFKIIIDVMVFFFVLSGFLIVYLYYDDLSVKSGNFYRYFINRFARIYPVYFLLVTIAILLSHDHRPVYLFKNYTLTHALFFIQKDRAIQQSWSITAEECFYLLAPFFMFLIRRFNYFSSLLSAMVLFGAALWISYMPFSFLHTPGFVFSVTFFGHFFEFFCGIFLALLILKNKKKEAHALKGSRWTNLGTCGILGAIGYLLLTNNMNDPHQAFQFYFINNFFLPIPVAILYFGLICENSLLSRLLSLNLLRLSGRASYSFYLVHMIIIESIAIPYVLPHFKGHNNLYVIFVFILTQLIALMIYLFYEQPLNMFIRKKFSPKQ